MALTVDELAHALGQATDDNDVLGVLTRLQDVATATIERYASSAPAEVKDEAAIRFCGHLLGPGRDRVRSFRVGGISMDFTQSSVAFRASGAMALVAPWRVHRAGTC